MDFGRRVSFKLFERRYRLERLETPQIHRELSPPSTTFRAAQVRFATAAASYLSSNDKRLHFGLGSAETAEIEVKWPSGVRQFLRGMKADQFLTVEELTSSLRSAAGANEVKQKSVPRL